MITSGLPLIPMQTNFLNSNKIQKKSETLAVALSQVHLAWRSFEHHLNIIIDAKYLILHVTIAKSRR
jgi:hypothetical protein